MRVMKGRTVTNYTLIRPLQMPEPHQCVHYTLLKGIRPYIQGYQFSRCRLIYSCVRWQINTRPHGQCCNSLHRHAEGLIGEERWDFISHPATSPPSLLKFQGTNVKKKINRQMTKFPHHTQQWSDKALFKHFSRLRERTGSGSGSQEG